MKIAGTINPINKELVDLDISKLDITEDIGSTISSAFSSIKPTLDASKLAFNNMPDLGNTI